MAQGKVNRENDEEIIDIINSILSNATFKVETFNESILVKLMELRGTPIRNINENLRDTESDYLLWLKNTKED